MPRSIICPSCGAHGTVPDSFIGDRVRCPQRDCRTVFDLTAVDPKAGDVYQVIDEPDPAPAPAPAPVVSPSRVINNEFNDVTDVLSKASSAQPTTDTAKPRRRDDTVSPSPPKPPSFGRSQAVRAGLAVGLVFLVVGSSLVFWRLGRGDPKKASSVATRPMPNLTLEPAPEPVPVPLPAAPLAVVAQPPASAAPAPIPPRDEPIPPEPPARRTLDEVLNSVARIEGERTGGTGFLVAPGILATNAHVVEGEYLAFLQITFPGGGTPETSKPFNRPSTVMMSSGIDGGIIATPARPFEPSGPVRLIFEDEKRDLVLLQIRSKVLPLEIADNHAFRAGEDVRIIGNPRIGGQNHITPGILSTRANFDGQEFDQLSAPINPGDSGGPVLDSEGRVIGVASMKAALEQGIGFSIPARDLQAALKAAARDERAIEALTRRHEARVLLKNLALAGSIDALAVGESVGGPVVASQIPRDSNEGWLRELREVGLDSLQDETTVLGQLRSNPNMSARTKGDLEALYKLVAQLHAQVVGVQPGGMMSGGVPIVGQPRKRLAELASGLATELGTEIDELAAWAPPLELVSLKFTFGSRTGSASVEGTVRNTSAGILEGIRAQIIFLHPQTGGILVRTSKSLIPERIDPGQESKFRANLSGRFDPRMIRVVLFTDAEGTFVPYRRRGTD